MYDSFLHENVLIRYWVERCNKYKLFDKKIIKAEANIPLSITPDIAKNVFEDHTIMPCEIKWCTTDFKDPEQINKVKNLNGFLLVFYKDKDDCPIPQIEIDKKDFQDWFVKSSKKLSDELLIKFSNEEDNRKEPAVFLNYLSISKAGQKNWKTALEHLTWGMNDKDYLRSNKEIKNIKKGDMILFFYSWKKNKKLKEVKGGRIRIDQFIGNFDKLHCLIATTAYYQSVDPKIWTDKEYLHRFKFRSLFEGSNIICSRSSLGPALHTFLHNLMSSPRFIRVDSSILLKALSLCTK